MRISSSGRIIGYPEVTLALRGNVLTAGGTTELQFNLD
jgi:hypothetical protein